MIKARIFHNPACGTSRKTLAILQEAGAEIEVVEYLKTPPSRAELVQLYGRACITRARACAPRSRSPTSSALTFPPRPTSKFCAAMVEHPILINRPLVETAKGVKLCRPQEEVRDLI